MIHVVQSGESLWKIANDYHVSIEALYTMNGLSDPNRLAPGQSLIIPVPESADTEPGPVIEVNAYTYQPSSEAVKSIQELGHLLTSVIPFVYHVQKDGSLDSLDDREIILEAKRQDVIPIMSIANFMGTEAGTDVAHAIFSSSQISENLLSQVIQAMQEKGYRGLNIDFENVQPSDREGYNRFLQRTVDLLHPLGYSVSTAVMPKTSAVQPGVSYEAYDYEVHGQIADFVILMTYEWGYRGGPPQAISPVDQMRRVIEYAVSVMPANKISMGFETYARDWLLPHMPGQEAETFSPLEAVERAIRYGANIQYNERAQSPFFRYTDEQGQSHEVWFEDARSAQAKFDLVKEFGLRGISYWALGFPFPQNWALLEDRFTIYKQP